MRSWLSFFALGLLLLVSSCKKSSEKILETIPREALTIRIDGKALASKASEASIMKQQLEKGSFNAKDSLRQLDGLIDLSHVLGVVEIKDGQPKQYFTVPVKDADGLKAFIAERVKDADEVRNGDLSCFQTSTAIGGHLIVVGKEQAWLYLNLSKPIKADEALAYTRSLESLEGDRQLAKVAHVSDLLNGDIAFYYPSSLLRDAYAKNSDLITQRLSQSPLLQELWSKENYVLANLEFKKQDLRLDVSSYGQDGKAVKFGDMEFEEVELKEAAAFFQPKQLLFGAFDLNPSIVKVFSTLAEQMLEGDAKSVLVLSNIKALLSKIDGTIAFGLAGSQSLVRGDSDSLEAALLLPVEEEHQTEFITQLKALIAAGPDEDKLSQIAIKALNKDYIALSPTNYPVEKKEPSYNKSKYASLLDGTYGGAVLDLSTGSPISMLTGMLGISLDGYLLLRATDKSHSELVWHNEAITEGNTLSFLIDKLYALAGAGHLNQIINLFVLGGSDHETAYVSEAVKDGTLDSSAMTVGEVVEAAAVEAAE